MSSQPGWFTRHEFLIRRLHSLSGLIPVGAFMTVHLSVNALILVGESSFQDAVFRIHSLGPFLWMVEWAFIFLPLIFHAVVGVIIMRSGKSNVARYSYTSNLRYTLQRISGVVALIFIFMHVLHMHGWIHVDAWINWLNQFGLARFHPYNAGSAVADAMQASMWVPLFYAVGILACVYHFANGIWTMGITWGVWTSPRAQQRASIICGGLGVLLLGVGMGSIVGFQATDYEEAKQVEDRMYEQRVEAGLVIENEHKRASHSQEGTSSNE